MPKFKPGDIIRLAIWRRGYTKGEKETLPEPAYAIVDNDGDHFTLLTGGGTLREGQYNTKWDPPETVSWVDYWQPLGDNFTWSLNAWPLDPELVPEDEVPDEVWARIALRQLVGGS